MSSGKDLYDASVSGDVAWVTQILSTEAGVDVDYRGQFGYTPLIEASYYGRPEVLQALLTHGADVNARDNSGRTALHWASDRGHPECVSALLAHPRVDVNAQNELNGDTALHYACMHGNLTVAELLLHAGADTQITNDDGKLAADLLDVSNENTPQINILLNDAKSKPKAAKLTPPKTESKAVLKPSAADVRPKTVQRNAGKSTPRSSQSPLPKSGSKSPAVVKPKSGKPTDVKSPPAAAAKSPPLQSNIKSPTTKKSQTVSKQGSVKHSSAGKMSKEENTELLTSINDVIHQLTSSVQKSIAQLETQINELSKHVQQNESSGHLQIRELKNLIESLREELRAKAADISQGVTHLIKTVDEQYVNNCQDAEYNELIFHKIFYAITIRIGSYPKKWKEFAAVLFANYPASYLASMVEKICNSYTTDKDKCLELLIHWKIFSAANVDKTPVLKAAISKVLTQGEANDVGKDIDNIISAHVDRAHQPNTGSLSDKGLYELADKINKDEWYDLALQLDFTRAQLHQLEYSHPGDLRRTISDMLCKWRDREEGYSDVKIGRLVEAFKKCGRNDIAKTLK